MNSAISDTITERSSVKRTAFLSDGKEKKVQRGSPPTTYKVSSPVDYCVSSIMTVRGAFSREQAYITRPLENDPRGE